MTRFFNGTKILLLLIIQIVPVVIILYFTLKFKQETERGGWIEAEESGCKCWTSRNADNRSCTWSGDCLDGYANGSGVLLILQHGYRHTVFEGTMIKGKAALLGTITWLDGDRYEGEFNDGLPSGFGRFYNDDGDYYEGNFKAGQRSGKGMYWYEPESHFLKYEGYWHNGLEEGFGTLYFRDGTQVSGTFRQGILTRTEE